METEKSHDVLSARRKGGGVVLRRVGSMVWVSAWKVRERLMSPLNSQAQKANCPFICLFILFRPQRIRWCSPALGRKICFSHYQFKSKSHLETAWKIHQDIKFNLGIPGIRQVETWNLASQIGDWMVVCGYT